MSDAEEQDEATYVGTLELVAGDEVVAARGTLSGVMQPIDGAYHWTGRLEPADALTALATKVGRKPIGVRAPGGTEVTARLGERNPWGGYRAAGPERRPSR
ncbi:DUF4873 domain-containing protein [Mumia sp. ZJ430]|uniref:DUF4873 domain-containing protein n=1 Tax=Mumia sp. ZJ430 TaxID=2708083 RepID=UPI00141E60C0|nr:DUF4873 domain-containing protein [Mumia sp. ZJ430]